MDALGQAVPFCNPKNGPFKSNLIAGIDDTCSEADFRYTFHEDGAELVDPGLRACKECPTEFFLPRANDGQILPIAVYLLLQIFNPLRKIIIVSPTIINLFLHTIHHRRRIPHITHRLILPNFIQLLIRRTALQKWYSGNSDRGSQICLLYRIFSRV